MSRLTDAELWRIAKEMEEKYIDARWTDRRDAWTARLRKVASDSYQRGYNDGSRDTKTDYNSQPDEQR
jgi:hypothetical protein